MEYRYYLANASLTLRVVEFLKAHPRLPLQYVTVIHGIEGWVVRIKMEVLLTPQADGDFRAVMLELGIPYQPSLIVDEALRTLAAGESALKVMEEYKVAVVSHGPPMESEIEAFREHFIEGLGYCPSNLA